MKFSVKSLSSISTLFQEDKGSLSYKLRQIILRACREVIGNKVTINPADVKMEHPLNENYGDYSTNIAMVMAGKLKMKPTDLAKHVVERLNNYIRQYQSTSSVSDSLSHQDKQKSSEITKIDPKTVAQILEKAEIAGSGFINLTIRKDYFSTELVEVLNRKNGVRSSYLEGKKVSVEYTDPNPFKEFHLGHLYSNTIGESLSRIFEANGTTVHRADYYGDVGMHIAKSLIGLLAKLKGKNAKLKILQGEEYIKELRNEIVKLENLPISQRQKLLGEGYALGVNKFEEDKKVQEEVKEINMLIYIAAQDLLTKNKGWKPIINYRKYIKVDEDKLKGVAVVYEAGLRWSLEYFETIYKRLGTKFDGYYPESWVGEYGIKLVEQGLEKGIMEKSDGSIVFKGEKYGLHTRVFVNKLGLPTYEAKELGLAPAKYENFKYDLSVIVTGNEIKEYFQVLLTVLRLIKPSLGNKTINLSHGMVRLPAGKMSSRTGNVITFEGLLDEAKRRALKIMKDVDVERQEKQTVAEAVALGAIRYALLKGSPGNDVVFDFDKSVSFDGDSGPYLMYTYARCKSVLRKSEIRNPKSEIKNSQLITYNSQLNPEELSLLRSFYRFPEIVAEAARTLSPNLVASFLFDLAQKYNLFYNKHSILNPDNRQQITDNKEQITVSDKDTWKVSGTDSFKVEESVKRFRLILTATTAQILKQGLHMLGIETVERM